MRSLTTSGLLSALAVVATLAIAGETRAGDTWDDATTVNGDLSGTEALSCKDAHEQAKRADLCTHGSVSGRIVKLDVPKSCTSCEGFRNEAQTTSYICHLDVTATCGPAGPPAPAPPVPGLPGEADCRDAAVLVKKPVTTQLDINMQAGARAMLAACDMGRAYADLARSVASSADGVVRLAAAQVAGFAFKTAHDGERFPYQDEQGHYGSILPMCQSDEGAEMIAARTRELRAGACTEGAASQAQASGAARAADAALNDAYRKVRAAYAKDPKFIAAFQRAEVAWIALRDAQVALAAARWGGPESACAKRELERVTRARTEQVLVWTKTIPEGDACLGSYGGP